MLSLALLAPLVLDLALWSVLDLEALVLVAVAAAEAVAVAKI